MPASIDDRRLTNRILAKWTAITEGQRIPCRAEITPEVFGADWTYCVVIALDSVLWRSRIKYIGEIMHNRDWSEKESQVLKDYADGSLLRLATAKIPAMMAKRGPIGFGGTGIHDNKAMLYRAILLPLSDDNSFIDHTLGAINFRDISATQDESLDEPVGYAVTETVKLDPVASAIAFASRRMTFAPTVARKLTPPNPV